MNEIQKRCSFINYNVKTIAVFINIIAFTEPQKIIYGSE
jgi:hypothetical protein